MNALRVSGVVALLLAASCVNVDTPRAWACPDGTGCDEGWFCATDGYCHDSTKGEPLACVSNDDCGGGFHCGATGVCYDRADAGAIACRRDDATAPLFAGGDCAEGWRCGVTNRCHLAVGAGAIACRYGVDSDCTDGWRCGFAGACVDPAGEQQTFGAATFSDAGVVARQLPAGEVLAISASERELSGASAELQTVLVQTDAGQVLVVRRVGNNGGDRVISVSSVSLGASPVRGAVTDGLGAWYFRGGTLRRAFLDGGELEARGADGGAVRESEFSALRLLPQGASQRLTVAFTPAANAGELTPSLVLEPDGTVTGVSLNEAVFDHIGFPTPLAQFAVRPNAACGIQVVQTGSARFFVLGQLNGGPLNGNCPLSLENYQPGDLRVGAGGAVGWVERSSLNSQPSVVRRAPRLSGVDYSAALACVTPVPSSCARFSCDRPCTAGEEELADFMPYKDGANVGFDVACRSGQGVRWARLIAGTEGCVRTSFPFDRELFGNVTQPVMRAMADGGNPHQPSDLLAPPQVPPGGYYRVVQRGVASNVFAGANVQHAIGWFNDRVPALAVELPAVGAAQLVGKDVVSVETASGFIASANDNSSPIRVVARVEGPEVLLVGANGVLVRVAPDATGSVDPREFGSLDIAPEAFVEPVRGVLSTGIGRSFVAVSVDDTLYTDLFPTDGGTPRPQPVVSPDPGQPIIGLADGEPEPDAGITNSVWVATRFSVSLSVRSNQVGWRAVSSGLLFPAPVVTVWNGEGPAGGHTARVGLTTGEVRSLPSGLTLSPNLPVELGEAQDYREICGQLLVVGTRGVARLTQGPTWQGLFSAADLTGGKVFDATPLTFTRERATMCRAMVVNKNGDVFRFDVAR